MDVKQRAERVRQQREQFGHASGLRPLPEELRQEAVACYRALLATGESAQAAADRLGLGALTLGRWSRRERALLAPVVVEDEPVAAVPVPSRLVVHGPRGLRIEGLDVAELAELLRRLA
ncbi:MAG: hypothetical protein QM765_49325 [Myxococcales bacterium]